jgi:NAD(P)-dependent dehydrogenase (short-subunit alcohol dehydrogenase family)
LSEELKTVLITGGTDGLGKATSILLAEQGYRTFAAGRDAERRAALDALARERKLPLETLEIDVCDDGSVDRAVGEIERRAGGVDALVNAAGIAVMATMEEITQRDLHLQLETNFFGVVRVIQRVLPGMRQRRRGRIVNVSSISGIIASPLFGPYSSSKFALEAISDAMRLELRPFGIHVIVLQPGFIPSGMEKASVGLSSQYTHGGLTSPYAGLYRNFLNLWKKTTRKRGGKTYQPIDFARVVLRALRETPPKPRYPVTRTAYFLRFARRLLTDRMIDRQTIRQLGIDRLRPGEPLDPAEAQAALAELQRREQP